MSASVQPVRGSQQRASGLTLELMDEVIDHMVRFGLWYQVNKGKDLDRDGLRQAAVQLLQQHGAVASHHVIEHLVIASVAMGQYEVLRDQTTRDATDAVLGDLGFTARELEQCWH